MPDINLPSQGFWNVMKDALPDSVGYLDIPPTPEIQLQQMLRWEREANDPNSDFNLPPDAMQQLRQSINEMQEYLHHHPPV